MPDGAPEIPAPFGKKPARGKKEDDSGQFEVPKRSMGFEQHPKKFKETRKLNVKETAKGFAKSFALLAGVEGVAAWAGGPVEALGAAMVLGPAFRPHAIYEERKKKVSEVI